MVTEDKNKDYSKNLTKFLENLDLLEGEIEVYLHLLSFGEKTSSEIVRGTEIPRVSVDRYLTKLAKKRLVSEIIRSSQKLYKANSPERFELKLKEKEVSLKKEMKKVRDMQNVFPSLLKELYSKQSGDVDDSSVSITVYKGKNEVWRLYEETLKADSYFSFADYEQYYKIFPNSRHKWTEALEDNPNRQVRDIVLTSDVSKQIKIAKHDRFKMKVLPSSNFDKDFEFADFIAFDNSVAIIQLVPENVVATEIKSKSFSLSLRTLHKMMWNLISD